MAGASKLFHTIVAMGASLGCGGEIRGTEGGRDAMAGSSAPFGGRQGGGPDAAVCGPGTRRICPSASACRCAPDPPQGICDCARPGEFRCTACAIGDPPVDGRCLSGDGSGDGCFCDTTRVVAAPSDCPHPEQFTCASFSGPSRYAECSCNLGAPLSAADCAPPDASFYCQGSECDIVEASEGGLGGTPNESVRFACWCGPPPPIIR